MSRSKAKIVRRVYIQSKIALTPPEVGAAEASSAMDIPTNRMKMLATAHCTKLVLREAWCRRSTYTPHHSGTTAVGDGIEQNRGNRRKETDDRKCNAEHLECVVSWVLVLVWSKVRTSSGVKARLNSL
jgi:hypothetical protein